MLGTLADEVADRLVVGPSTRRRPCARPRPVDRWRRRGDGPGRSVPTPTAGDEDDDTRWALRRRLRAARRHAGRRQRSRPARLHQSPHAGVWPRPGPWGRGANPPAPTAASRRPARPAPRCPREGRGPSPWPRPEGGRRGPGSGPGRGHGRRCRAPHPDHAPSVSSPLPLPTPCTTRARGRAPAPSRVTAEWFSKPVSVRGPRGRAPCPEARRTGAAASSPTAAASGPFDRRHVQEPQPGVGPPVGARERLRPMTW